MTRFVRSHLECQCARWSLSQKNSQQCDTSEGLLADDDSIVSPVGLNEETDREYLDVALTTGGASRTAS